MFRLRREGPGAERLTSHVQDPVRQGSQAPEDLEIAFQVQRSADLIALVLRYLFLRMSCDRR